MELIVCLLLASLVTGGRIATDIVYGVKGGTPPHVEKARLKAERARLKAQAQGAPGGRSPYAAGKPRMRDVAAVYWGDALAEVIEAHNRRREQKRNPQPATAGEPAVQGGPSLGRQMWDLIVRPVGEKPDTPPQANPAPQDPPAPPVADGPITTCPECGQALINRSGGWEHPSSAGCPKQPPAPTPTNPTAAPPAPRRDLWKRATCRRCNAPLVPRFSSPGNPFCPFCAPNEAVHEPDAKPNLCQLCGLPGSSVRPPVRGVPEFVHTENQSTICPHETAKSREFRRHNPGMAGAYDKVVADYRAQYCNPAPTPDSVGAPPPHPDLTPEPSNTATGGDTMTAPTHTAPAPAAAGSGAGEAVNYETAMAELDELEKAQRDHLDQALAAQKAAQDHMTAISNTQATYRPAADAAGSIHQHLTALNLDQDTVANTGTIADAMPPNRVDEMFTQIEAIKAATDEQVANAEAALAATQAARTNLIEKYGDANTTVQTHLAGDSRFLDGSGARTA